MLCSTLDTINLLATENKEGDNGLLNKCWGPSNSLFNARDEGTGLWLSLVLIEIVGNGFKFKNTDTEDLRILLNQEFSDNPKCVGWNFDF